MTGMSRFEMIDLLRSIGGFYGIHVYMAVGRMVSGMVREEVV
jgi:hypothetical protein